MANNYRIRNTLLQRETILGWIYMIFEVLALPVLLSLANRQLGYPLGSAWLNFIYFCINFLAVLMIFHSFLGKSLSHLGGNFLRTLRAAFLGFCVYYVSTLAMNALMNFLFPWFSNVNDDSIASMLALDYLPMLIGTVFLVPITEEVLYRGLLFQPFYNTNRVLGYVASTALFALAHVAGYIGSSDILTLCLCFIQYIPAGLCLAWAYAEADNIFAPILIHTVVNAMAVYSVR